MILIDNNQLLISNVFVAMKHSDIEDESTLRHLVVNTYRYYNQKFKNEYGDMIICHDSSKCWRKDIFEHYKSNRKKAKEKSQHDWNKIFNTMTTIRGEIEESFPWKNMSVPCTEADDIIAVITQNSSPMESIVIVSSDKDFQQLQRFPDVQQYSPHKKNMIVCEDPEAFLIEHMVKGDVSDGIPNVLSDDDTFIDPDKKQTTMTKKRVNEAIGHYTSGALDFEETQVKYIRNWIRNKTMIDMTQIPQEHKDRILDEWAEPTVGDKSQVFEYMVNNRLGDMVDIVI